MDIVCWDARGATCAKFGVNVLELVRTHHMDILFVCEPQISGGKAIFVAKSLGFSNYEIVNPIGFSSGLWLLRNENKVVVDILGINVQAIAACVSWPGQLPWFFTAVYAKLNSVNREKLWDYLNFVVGCHQFPWLLAGDFIEMLSVEDKLGGAVLSRLKEFKSWVNVNDMVDFGFSGPKFTWTNNRMFERIDRVIWYIS